MGVRQDLTTAIRGAVTTPGVSVYAAPHDVPSLPAVVVEGADPYITPHHTFGAGAYEWVFVIHITVRRTDPASAYDLIESLRSQIAAGIRSLPDGTDGPMTAPAGAILNDTDVVESSLGVLITTNEGT